VHADRGQLEQVLLNLAVNGRDAMPRGGTLTVETSALDVAAAFTDGQVSLERGRWVCMAVTDTGCGMAPDLVARVFEPFFTTKGPGKGTGLGLSTVYGIVAQSGGHIALDSCVGHGTTFRMYLPEVSQASVAPTVPARPDGRKSGTETILLVEDERGIRKLIRIALERHGYTVLEAASGEQALGSAREHQGGIHLLLSDIVMPGMSGVDLAQHLIVERPALKVMHMSGFAVAAHAGKLSPNVTFLQKPFTVEALTRQVRRCLDSGASGGVVQK
jgi:CheY-like chemotaxis protein